LTKSKTKL